MDLSLSAVFMKQWTIESLKKLVLIPSNFGFTQNISIMELHYTWDWSKQVFYANCL